jgi:hypothetical protein
VTQALVGALSGTQTRLAEGIRVDELMGSDDNLDVLARATFTAAGVQPPWLETTIHGVFRFDEAGRIALLYLTPYDVDALDAYLP